MSAVDASAQQAPRRAKASSRSTGARILSVIWTIIKWLIVLVLGIALGVAIWFGARAAYSSILTPIQSNTHAIAALEQSLQAERNDVTRALERRDARIAELETALAQEQARSNELTRQLDAVSSDLATLRSDVASIQTGVEGVRTSLEQTQTQLDDLQTDLATTEGTIEALESDLSDVRTALDTTSEEIDALNTQLADVNTTLDQNSTDLNAMSSDIADLQLAVLAPSGAVGQLQQKAVLLNAQAHLLNARFALSQQNAGLAGEYLEQARTAVAGLDSEDERVTTAVARIDEAIQQLEAEPFAADAELTAAWRALAVAVQAEE